MTPRNMSMGIMGSVGKGGRNNLQDVKTVQTLLNERIKMPTPKLVVDGKCGRKTKEAITQFQKKSLRMMRPDGRVDPAGKTILALNDPGNSLNYTPAPPMPNHPGSGELKFKDVMKDEFKKRGGNKSNWDDFIKDFETNTIPAMKVFLGLISRAEDARSLARFYLTLKKLGFDTKDIRAIFTAVSKYGNLDKKNILNVFDNLSSPTGKAGKNLKFGGGAAGKAGIIVMAIECLIFAKRGEYSRIAAEMYKFGMGNAVPWAAMVDGVWSLLDGVLPKESKNFITYRIVRALDPIGLGAVYIDTYVTMIHCWVDMALKGKISLDDPDVNKRLEQLAARMRQGPTSVFAEIGTSIGDAMGNAFGDVMYEYILK